MTLKWERMEHRQEFWLNEIDVSRLMNTIQIEYTMHYFPIMNQPLEWILDYLLTFYHNITLLWYRWTNLRFFYRSHFVDVHSTIAFNFIARINLIWVFVPGKNLNAWNRWISLPNSTKQESLNHVKKSVNFWPVSGRNRVTQCSLPYGCFYRPVTVSHMII